MINNWLSYNEKKPCPYSLFRVIDVSEKNTYDTNIISYLGTELIKSYRNLNELKTRYENSSKDDLIKYINNYVFPSDAYQIVRNVKQGDFGEFLAGIIVSYFQGLVIPIHKMRYKFNKDRSVFCTDMMAHNSGDEITDLYYYEIKSRQDTNKETVNKMHDFVTVHAHNSLLKDEKTPNEGIADFLSQRYYEMGDYDRAEVYGEIVKSPEKYNRNFELFFIIEKNSLKEDILKALQELPPTLKPLCVTVVLIENLNKIVKESYDIAIANAISYVFPKAL